MIVEALTEYTPQLTDIRHKERLLNSLRLLNYVTLKLLHIVQKG